MEAPELNLRIEINQILGVVNLMFGNECVDQMTITEWAEFRLTYHIQKASEPIWKIPTQDSWDDFYFNNKGDAA